MCLAVTTGDDFGWEFADNVGGGVGTDGVDTEANEASPAIFEDDATGVLTLYFDSNRPGGLGSFADDPAHNGNDIYASIFGRDETFGPAVLVAELSTPSPDRQPAIRRDGLEIKTKTDSHPEELGTSGVKPLTPGREFESRRPRQLSRGIRAKVVPP
jgi:hypothetical protein